MLTIVAFIIVLGGIVFVHELGHFCAAKLTGVRVLEFGMGFPPRLLSFRRGDTIYSINVIPFGGFVKLPGEDDPSEPDGIAGKSATVRLFILGAGSAMNFLLPVLLFTIYFLLPRAIPVTDVVILDVAAGSPAIESGLDLGDKVREIDGRTINNSTDLRAGIQLRLGSESKWLVERNGQMVHVLLTPRIRPPDGEGSVGILLADARISIGAVEWGSPAHQAGLRQGDLLIRVGHSPVLFTGDTPLSPSHAVATMREEATSGEVPILALRDGNLLQLILPATARDLSGMELTQYPETKQSEPIWRAVPAGIHQTMDVLVMFRNEVAKWIRGASPEAVGPIGIAQFTGEAAKGGINNLLFWTALLSINVGIINLLPVPALDGGRISFVLLELVRGGRRVSPEKERVVHMVGFAGLLAVLVLVTIGDIRRLLD